MLYEVITLTVPPWTMRPALKTSTLFDSMTLLDNVALPIRKHYGVGMKEARERARITSYNVCYTKLLRVGQ